jgi:hypothetical protein
MKRGRYHRIRTRAWLLREKSVTGRSGGSLEGSSHASRPSLRNQTRLAQQPAGLDKPRGCVLRKSVASNTHAEAPPLRRRADCQRQSARRG